MANIFALTQRAYRFYNDNGSESTGTAAAAENTALVVKPNGTKQYILRIGLGETGAGSINGATTDDYQLQRSYDGGAYANVTTTSTVVKAFASGNLTDAGVTTNRASDPLSDGGGSFVAGEISETGLITDRQITANNFTEFVYTVEVVAADVTDGKNIDFRVLLNGATTNVTYTVTPRITVSTVDAALANDVQSTSSVSTVAVGQKHGLLANDVSSTSSVSTVAVGQKHALLANDVSSTSEVSTPALTEVGSSKAVGLFSILGPAGITKMPYGAFNHAATTVDDLHANDIESASSVSVPALTQVHALLANDVESVSSVSAPATKVPLAANDIESASSVSVPVLVQVVALAANDVESASSVSVPAVAQVHNLVADFATSASEVSASTLVQVHILNANDVESASTLSIPTLVEVPEGVNALAANDVESASSVSVPALGQVHVLLADDVESASSVSIPTLVEQGVTPPVVLPIGGSGKRKRLGLPGQLSQEQIDRLREQTHKRRRTIWERPVEDQPLPEAARPTQVTSQGKPADNTLLRDAQQLARTVADLSNVATARRLRAEEQQRIMAERADQFMAALDQQAAEREAFHKRQQQAAVIALLLAA